MRNALQQTEWDPYHINQATVGNDCQFSWPSSLLCLLTVTQKALMLLVFKENDHTDICRKHAKKVTPSTVVLTHSLTHSPSLLLVRHKPSPCVILWYSITNYLFLQYELRLWHQSICHPFNCGNHSLTHSSSSSSLKHKASPHVILWYSSTNLFLWPQTITSIISYIVIHPGFVTMTLFLLNLVNWTSQFPNSSTPLTPDKDNRDNRRRGHCLTREGAIEFSNLPT